MTENNWSIMNPPPNLYGLPPEMLDMIFKKVSLVDKRNIRLVCHRFKNVVERQADFRVKLTNDTVNSVSEFSSVHGKISSLVVESFNQPLRSMSSSRSILANKTVHELILCGRIGYDVEKTKTQAKPFHYPYLPNETVVLRQMRFWMYGFLDSSEDTLSSGSNIRHLIKMTGATLSALVLTSDVLKDLGNNSLTTLSSQLTSLNSFEFILLHHTKPVAKRIKEACRALFQNRFKCLQKVGLETKCPCNGLTFHHWELFYKFLIGNKSTVRELDLRHHFHFDYSLYLSGSDDDIELVQELKTVQLKRLSLVSLPNAHRFRDLADPNQPSKTLEMVLLKSQKNLEVLKLDCGIHIDRIFEAVIPTCASLEACSIHVYDSRERLSNVDLAFLRKSKKLRVLQISCHEDYYAIDSPWKLRGLRSLPTSLEKLCLSTDLTVDDAMWIQKNLTNLKHLRYFGGIRRSVDDYEQLPLHTTTELNFAHFKDCVKALPRLKYFELAFNNNLISTHLLEAPAKVQYRVKMSFSNFTLPYHEQH